MLRTNLLAMMYNLGRQPIPMMSDCLPALGIRESPLTGSFIEECIGRVDLGGAVEGGRYDSVHGPSGMGFGTFDRLRVLMTPV